MKCSAASAVRLVSKHSLSTKKAAIVCKSLKEDGVDIASPTQVDVWKNVIKEAELKKSKYQGNFTKRNISPSF